ncbi:hypothetical protein Ahy_B07g086194 [Arachis hypogaea]|uniref:Aminotransferase-like plant mobile domain-containing protein n=1 Tax=Arachis hypogaea TaxID=3818 RepID=A0A444Y976_ARAHY|nr:hypothetical protein Ahy_B07g086194 [Arachis hypogaea]
MNVLHKLLKELANYFNLDKNKLDTSHGSFKVKPKIIGAALDHNASGDLFPDKGKTLKNLTDEMMNICIDNDQDRLMFKRFFFLYIQMAFLLPTTINKVSSVHLAPIFWMDNVTKGNWGAHVLNFIIKGITNYCLKKKKLIDSCLYTLMIVYFHLTKHVDKKGEAIPRLPWLLVVRIRVEIDGHMGIVKKAEVKKKLKEMKEK